MLKSVAFIALIALAHPAGAQGLPANTAAPSHSVYAINSAALATAMTYCSTRHGNLLSGSAGQACFVKARQWLASRGLKKVVAQVDARCNDPATFSTCLTPEVGKLVYALNAEFTQQAL